MTDIGSRDRKPERSLLLVDDEPGILEEMANFFRKRGFIVYTENNAASAFETLKEHQPFVAVVDVNMPGFTGIDLATFARDLEKRPRIILMSGNPDWVAEANQSNLDDIVFAVVDKPMPLVALLQFVQRAMVHDWLK
ncbi:MAG: response regulator [Rhodospirillaceae bacterium]|nr:response regulator [Rhodospirillaceae bacterium]